MSIQSVTFNLYRNNNEKQIKNKIDFKSALKISDVYEQP